MVQLCTSSECQSGKHDKCAGSYSPPNRDGQPVFGGWRCTCHCHTPKPGKCSKCGRTKYASYCICDIEAFHQRSAQAKIRVK